MTCTGYVRPVLDVEALLHLSRTNALPEMKPLKQLRSCVTVLALIDAGRELLLGTSLEELSVDAVCKKSGTTVGSFYSRFESKDFFFVTLQRLVTAELQFNFKNFFARHHGSGSQPPELAADLVSLLVAHFRTHTGVLRASLENASRGSWKLLRSSGDEQRRLLAEQIGPLLVNIGQGQRGLRIMFAYQIILGVLTHTTLNDVGPLRLFDERLVPELERTTLRYLSGED